MTCRSYLNEIPNNKLKECVFKTRSTLARKQGERITTDSYMANKVKYIICGNWYFSSEKVWFLQRPKRRIWWNSDLTNRVTIEFLFVIWKLSFIYQMIQNSLKSLIYCNKPSAGSYNYKLNFITPVWNPSMQTCSYSLSYRSLGAKRKKRLRQIFTWP